MVDLDSILRPITAQQLEDYRNKRIKDHEDPDPDCIICLDPFDLDCYVDEEEQMWGHQIQPNHFFHKRCIQDHLDQCEKEGKRYFCPNRDVKRLDISNLKKSDTSLAEGMLCVARAFWLLAQFFRRP